MTLTLVSVPWNNRGFQKNSPWWSGGPSSVSRLYQTSIRKIRGIMLFIEFIVIAFSLFVYHTVVAAQTALRGPTRAPQYGSDLNIAWWPNSIYTWLSTFVLMSEDVINKVTGGWVPGNGTNCCTIPTDQCNPNNIVCPLNYNPVCGCDNVTYGNSCESRYYGCVRYYSPGRCQ